MRHRALVRLGATALALAGAPGVAHADGIADLQGLLEEPVISSASRTPESRSAAPATSTIIGADDLWRYGIRSLGEAINFLSLGMFTQDPLHPVEIGSRGVLVTGDFGDHVLLLIDGHAINEQWDGTAYYDHGAAIPFELIDHIEIIVGPGSVLYGGNAMLGVINVVTKRAKDYKGTHVVLDGSYPLTFRGGVGAGYEFKLFHWKSEVIGQAEYYAQSGPAFTFGPQSYGNDGVTGMPKRFSATGTPGIWGGVPSTTYDSQVPAGLVKLTVGDVEIMVRAAMYQRGNPYISVDDVAVLAYNDPSSYERDRWFSFDIKHKATLSGMVSLASRLYGDSYDYKQRAVTYAAEDCLPGQINGCIQYQLGVSRWLGLEERGTFDWTRDGRFETQIGVDGRLRFIGAEDDFANPNDVVVASISPYTSYQRALALYGQQIVRPVPWLTLNAGARLDVDEGFGQRLSPRAALVLSPRAGTTAKLIYAEAFRPPNAYEIYFADPSYQVAGGRNLRPEVTRSLEALLEQRVGTHRVLIGAFRSFFYDMVVPTTLSSQELAAAVAAGQVSPGASSAQQYRNAASIDAYGFEGAIEGTAVEGRFRYGVNATGAYARTSTDGGPLEPVPVAPSFYGNAHASYSLQHGLPDIALAGLLASQRLADQAIAGGFKGGWYAPPQASLRLTASGAAPFLKGLNYRLFGEYSAGSRNPYVVGPLQSATPTQPNPELVPVVQYRVGLGLRYDLPF